MASAFVKASFFFLISLFLLAVAVAAEEEDCHGLGELKDHEAICAYLKAHASTCAPEGFIDYLQLFYCSFGDRPLLGYALLLLCLLLLFYLLGDTASVYFCSSLEGLSAALHLTPTIAGVTLLSLGNGAPDVFSSLVSFSSSSGVADVGLSSVLGGAFFVSTVVVAAIAFVIDGGSAAIDRASFLRDLCFFLFILAALSLVLVTGRTGIWGAIAFFSLYFVYVLLVWAMHHYKNRNSDLLIPILDGLADEEDPETKLASEEPRRPKAHLNSPVSHYFFWFIYLLKMPLYLPRRLTIPDVSKERWSKPFTVASVSLSPLFLATLWLSETGEVSTAEKLTLYFFGSLIGLVLGAITMVTTESSSPPKSLLFPWLAGGFLMSVIWSYLIAAELVSLLVSIGEIAHISPLVLAFTVLAWGNSLGDLIANLAMAIHGGGNGVQIAISGCYAGPIFNTLVGLGLSLVLASVASYPTPFVVPQDTAIFETLGFLIGGLLWALIILPRRGMKPDRVLGVGLLAIYLTFLCLRLLESLDLVN
ncbi:cation/calcium exchanger 1-like [Curcuma longa]|uniref:cation/calcium exchanger 1-like n=1 Tax=Curcuma longa TaxID=136217 RepID=UPI003D9E9CCC